MSGVILAVLEHPASAARTLAAAQGIAGLMGHARINVLAVRVPPESTILPTEEVLTSQAAARIRADERVRVAALRQAFEAWCDGARSGGTAAEWSEVEGLADAVVSEWGRRSDFIVLDRPARHGDVADRMRLQAALFDTDRPVLVVPPGGVAAFGRCVAIAWRDDKRTIRAVLAALRLLSQAREVHVLTGVRAGAAAPGLPEILAEHDIAATLHVLPVGSGVFGEALLAEAHALGADMLVMGAYTHSAWRDLLPGGVTRHMLTHADLPVLMRH